MRIRRRKLSTDRVKEIRSLAEIKLKEFDSEDIPVDIEIFAQNLGALVKYAPYEDGELAGMLVRENGKNPMIAVNSAHHPNRRRFTIAHECGHLLLHDREVFIDETLSVTRKRDGVSSLAISTEEIEANQFAAEVLMPRKHLLNDIRNLNLDVEDDTETVNLAKKYKVSIQAMSYRIFNITSESIFQ